MSTVAEQCAHGIPMYRSCHTCGRIRTVTAIVPSFPFLDEGTNAPKLDRERLARAIQSASVWAYRSGSDHGGHRIEWRYLHDSEKTMLLAEVDAIADAYEAEP